MGPSNKRAETDGRDDRRGDVVHVTGSFEDEREDLHRYFYFPLCWIVVNTSWKAV